jgi:hypothetical protein
MPDELPPIGNAPSVPHEEGTPPYSANGQPFVFKSNRQSRAVKACWAFSAFVFSRERICCA